MITIHGYVALSNLRAFNSASVKALYIYNKGTLSESDFKKLIRIDFLVTKDFALFEHPTASVMVHRI